MDLSKWEKEWSKKSVGQKAVRRGEKKGLEIAGIKPFLIDAYIGGMFEMGTLLRIRDVQTHPEPDENTRLLTMVMSYEHNRAARMASLDQEWPDKGPKGSWSSTMWFRNNTPWVATETQVEVMVPGLSEGKKAPKRVKDHLEVIVQMSGVCEGIIDRLQGLAAHEFEVIINLCKKEMVDEERRLLGAFVSGDFTAEDVYKFVEDYELTKDENLEHLSKILDGADQQAILFAAGLWQD